MAKIGLPKGSGKRLKVREKSVKSQGIFKWILSGNPETVYGLFEYPQHMFWLTLVGLQNLIFCHTLLTKCLQ